MTGLEHRYRTSPNLWDDAALLFQTEFVHRRGEKHWALLQGGQDRSDLESPENCCPIRFPTPTEVKLGAWLAVACDVDGIMWYPWGFGGLLTLNNENEPTAIYRTDRYDSARAVCNEIQRLMPTLESLDFVRTYASRAFERDYPNDTLQAVWRDTLATNCYWNGHPYRSVQSIQSWAPDSIPSDWQASAEDNSYVQVSRFRNRIIAPNDPDVENYWFLIVNRRALPGERRKVELTVEIDTTHMTDPYFIEYVLGESLAVAAPTECADLRYDCRTRLIDAVLEPGEAELVHFYRGMWGCSQGLQVDTVREVTACSIGPGVIRLRWSRVNDADKYYLCGSTSSNGPWAPFAVTTDTTYIDSAYASHPRYFYTVQACWSEQ